MASHQEIRRRCSSAADRTPSSSVLAAAAAAAAAAATVAKYSPPTETATRDPSGVRQEKKPRMDGAIGTSSPPLPARPGDHGFRGHGRSQSLASRQVNRLSLTLPIAPPTSDPSRPTPTSTTMSPVPPTPIDSVVASPADANEFIIAIAAQERRVLELREELSRAETELHVLKKKWTAHEGSNRRGQPRPVDVYRSPVLSSDDESVNTRRSLEMDRRKMMLQNQAQHQHQHPEQGQAQDQQHNGPAQNRRRVIRGGHTRTLSLLSPAKADSGFSLHHEHHHHQPRHEEPAKLPPIERRTAQLTNPSLAKRASWQPRTQQNVSAVPQIMEDFKLGFRAFVEDIRQITVGDEPINGQGTRTTSVDYKADGASGSNANNANFANFANFATTSDKGSPSNQDTIRASRAARPKVSTVFDSPKTVTSSPTPSSRPEEAPREKEKPKPVKSKHFSWTPLGFDSLDDNDWSNWESSPSASSSVKTSRWSGSTMGSSGIEDMDGVPDADAPASTPSKKKKNVLADAPILTPKLEEILPNMVNRLSPSNIKRTATNLMDEWEKSLAEPQPQLAGQNKENAA